MTTKALALLFLVAAFPATAAEPVPVSQETVHLRKIVVVSKDVPNGMLTFEDETGVRVTLPVKKAALGTFRLLHGGETVTIGCEDDAQGRHTAIRKIKVSFEMKPQSELP